MRKGIVSALCAGLMSALPVSAACPDCTDLLISNSCFLVLMRLTN